MGLLTFFKDAGEKIFGIHEAKAAQEAPAPDPDAAAKANAAAGEAIVAYMNTMNVQVDGLAVEVDGAAGSVTVSGQAPSQEAKEKALLCCGNVHGVETVNDLITVAEPADESQYYTVVKGDNLSKISKEFYDTPNKYMAIFEANKPMLTHPDKIYPGQMLRIPAEA
ncbi:MAG: peptidoglycan-binding protein LysM [Betaproteobacteria bacterium]|nr:peptidoglycan-binding protein LysM [Betaproteobacteria bacterium]MDE2047849.1 peptidoglycan-binding protein LysM [Betaproteobacteria bacterium]